MQGAFAEDSQRRVQKSSSQIFFKTYHEMRKTCVRRSYLCLYLMWHRSFWSVLQIVFLTMSRMFACGMFGFLHFGWGSWFFVMWCLQRHWKMWCRVLSLCHRGGFRVHPSICWCGWEAGRPYGLDQKCTVDIGGYIIQSKGSRQGQLGCIPRFFVTLRLGNVGIHCQFFGRFDFDAEKCLLFIGRVPLPQGCFWD